MTVTIGGVACPVTSATATTIQCTAPAGFGVTLAVVVTVAAQTSNTLTFSYQV